MIPTSRLRIELVHHEASSQYVKDLIGYHWNTKTTIRATTPDSEETRRCYPLPMTLLQVQGFSPNENECIIRRSC
jgi:hypothetical protein